MMEELSKGKESLLVQLKRKKIRYEKRMFVAEGEKCVLDSLSHFDCEFLVAEKKYLDNLDASSGTPFHDRNVYYASESVMKKISSFSTPSRLLGCFRIPDVSSFPDEPDRYELLLDGVQDPGNLGTIIRTADWFGFRRIFASINTADQYNAKTVQAAMGSCGRVEVIYCDLKHLTERYPDRPVIGLVLDGEDIYKAQLPGKGFIVMGNEGNGVSREMIEKTSVRLRIPSFPLDSDTAESLNVAVATAITVSEFRRKEFE